MGILFFLTVLLIAHRFLDHKEIGLIWERLAPGFIPILVGLPAVYMWLKSGRYVNLFAVSGPPLEGARERDLTRLSYLSAQMVTLLPGGYVARVHVGSRSPKLSL